MNKKYQNKYRIQSTRLQNWDYAGNGIYFITIVTQNHECILGQIKNNKMILSDFGKIVKNEFLKSFEIRDELFLDEFIIMPNHLHAIIILKKTNKIELNDELNDLKNGSHDLLDGSHVETHGRASLQQQQQPTLSEKLKNQSIFMRKPKSISSFIGGFKSAINTKIDDYIDKNNLKIPKYNKNNHFFQTNYHDHIIRNDKSFARIKNYIINNPKKWNIDKFNSENNE